VLRNPLGGKDMCFRRSEEEWEEAEEDWEEDDGNDEER